MSLIRDPEVYERFEQVIVVHGVRTVSELGYSDYIRRELPENELIGDEVRAQLRYYPTVTREAFANQGRITHLIESGKLTADLGAAGSRPDRRPRHDLRQHGDAARHRRDPRRAGFEEGSSQAPAHYVIERAFVGS